MNRFHLEEYQIQNKPLGKGCSGEVFRAQRDSENQEYIVKRYNSMSMDRNLMDDMCNRLQNAPEHPGIIPVSEFRFSATPYYTISHFEHGKKLINCSQFEEDQAMQVIDSLADALGHAHKYGVVHGNLHPGNVFYHFDDELNMRGRIGDFGAGMIGDVHYVDLAETAYYAPPEQLQCLGSDYKFGKAQKWDVYRFGAIAFWILNQRLSRGVAYQQSRAHDISESGGRPVPVDPYALANEMENDRQVAWGEDSVGDSPYKKLIERCLSLNPDDRPFDMQEAAREFDVVKETVLKAKIEVEAKAAEVEEKIVLPELEEIVEEHPAIEIPPPETRVEEPPVQSPVPLPIPKKVKKKRFIDWFRTDPNLEESTKVPR